MGRPRKIAGIRILEVLYDRGMAIVYRGLSPKYGDVVVKVPKEGVDLASFVWEAELQKRLEHKHIVRAHEVAREAGWPCLVMERVTAPTLAMIVEGYRPGVAMLSARAIAAVGLHVCEALDFAYRRGRIAAHCDIKPNNIFAQVSGDEVTLVKLTDFGIAKPLGADPYATRVIGQPHYMAPEQFGTRQEVSQQTDVYSLGCVLYALATGRPPFRGSDQQLNTAHCTIHPLPPLHWRADLPQELNDLILRCLAKEPADRFGSVLELSAALAAIAGVPAPVPTPVEPIAVPPPPALGPRVPRPLGPAPQREPAVGGFPLGAGPPTPTPARPKAALWGIIAASAALAVVVVGGAVLLIIASIAEVEVYNFNAGWSPKNRGVALTWRIRRRSAFSSYDLPPNERGNYSITVLCVQSDRVLRPGSPPVPEADATLSVMDLNANPDQGETYEVYLRRKDQGVSGRLQDVKRLGPLGLTTPEPTVLPDDPAARVLACKTSIEALRKAASSLFPADSGSPPERWQSLVKDEIAKRWKAIRSNYDGSVRKQTEELDKRAQDAAAAAIRAGKALSPNDLDFFARPPCNPQAWRALRSAQALWDNVRALEREGATEALPKTTDDGLTALQAKADGLSNDLRGAQATLPPRVQGLCSGLGPRITKVRSCVDDEIKRRGIDREMEAWVSDLRKAIDRQRGGTVKECVANLAALTEQMSKPFAGISPLPKRAGEALADAGKRLIAESDILLQLAHKGVCAQAANEAKGVLGEVRDLGLGRALTDEDSTAVRNLPEAQDPYGKSLSGLKSAWGAVWTVHTGLLNIVRKATNEAEIKAAAEGLRTAAAGAPELHAIVSLGEQLGRAKLALPQPGDRDVKSLRRAREQVAQVVDSLQRIATGRDSDVGKLRDEVSRRLAARRDAMAATIVAELNAGYERAIRSAQEIVNKPGTGSTVEACRSSIAALAKAMDAVREHEKAFERREDISPANADGAKALLAATRPRIGREARAAFDVAIKPLCTDKLESTLADAHALDGVLADARKAGGEGVDAVQGAWDLAKRLSASRQGRVPATEGDLDHTIAALKDEYRADLLRALFVIEKWRLRHAVDKTRALLEEMEVRRKQDALRKEVAQHPLTQGRVEVEAMVGELCERYERLIAPKELLALEEALKGIREGKTVGECKRNIVELADRALRVREGLSKYSGAAKTLADRLLGDAKGKVGREAEGMVEALVASLGGGNDRPTRAEEADFREALGRLKDSKLVDTAIVNLVGAALDAAAAVRSARPAGRQRTDQELNDLLTGLHRTQGTLAGLARAASPALRRRCGDLEDICGKLRAEAIYARSPYSKASKDDLERWRSSLEEWKKVGKAPPEIERAAAAIAAIGSTIKDIDESKPAVETARGTWQNALEKAKELTEALRAGRMPDGASAVKAFQAARVATERLPQRARDQCRGEEAQAAKELGPGLAEAAQRMVQAAEREAIEREVTVFFGNKREAFKGSDFKRALEGACSTFCEAPRNPSASGSRQMAQLLEAAGTCCRNAVELGLGSDMVAQTSDRVIAMRGTIHKGFREALRAALMARIAEAVAIADHLNARVVFPLLGGHNNPWRPGAIAPDQEERKRKTVVKALQALDDAEKTAKSALHKLILSAKAEEISAHYNGTFEGNYGLDDANLRDALYKALQGRNRIDSPMTFKMQDFLLEQLDRRAKEPKARVAGKDKTSGGSRHGAAGETVAAGGAVTP
ncbi:MAG: hypothetical protein FJ290_18615 [Planctomycetes bacterium]|nr:hypothetical protein [Planctomycetota bacterium]